MNRTTRREVLRRRGARGIGAVLGARGAEQLRACSACGSDRQTRSGQSVVSLCQNNPAPSPDSVIENKGGVGAEQEVSLGELPRGIGRPWPLTPVTDSSCAPAARDGRCCAQLGSAPQFRPRSSTFVRSSLSCAVPRIAMAGASSIKMMITNLTEKAILSPDLSRSRGRVIKLYRDTLRHIPWIKQTYKARSGLGCI